MKYLRPIFIVIGFILVIYGGIFMWQTRNNLTPDMPKPPLRDLAAKKHVSVGNFSMPKLLKNTMYSDILTSQFSFGLIDNQPNWHFTDHDLRPTEKTFNFQKIDEVLAFNETHGMSSQAHHFVWGEEKWLPDWLIKGHYSKEQLLQILQNHITTVGARYHGRIKEWTVVNEAFTRGQHIFGLRDWWADNIGDQSYIDKSFIWARQADPNAKLILNDFNNEGQNQVSDAMYAYVKGAKERGVPIDGVGMQMHIDGTHPPVKDEVIVNMKRFASLGVEVYVTEFDVNMNDVKADSKAKDQTEGSIYYDMARACVESGVCHSFAVLGITDAETWYNYLGLKDSRPLPFDKNYRPKPAFFALRQAFIDK